MTETNQEINEEPEEKKNNQITGNTGMYYVCYQLSRRKWNAMPTSRNAKGIDIVAYSNTGKCVGIQVKTISNLVNICFGKKVEYIFDYLVIVALDASSNKDEKEKDEHVVYILSKEETKQMMSRYGKDKNFWLRIDLIIKNEHCFENNWDKIVKNNREITSLAPAIHISCPVCDFVEVTNGLWLPNIWSIAFASLVSPICVDVACAFT